MTCNEMEFQNEPGARLLNDAPSEARSNPLGDP